MENSVNKSQETLDTLMMIYGEHGVRQEENGVILIKDDKNQLGYYNPYLDSIVDCRFAKIMAQGDFVIGGSKPKSNSMNDIDNVELHFIKSGKVLNVGDGSFNFTPKADKLVIGHKSDGAYIYSAVKEDLVCTVPNSEIKTIKMWGDPKFVVIAYKVGSKYFGVLEDGTAGEILDILKHNYPNIKQIREGRTTKYKLAVDDSEVVLNAFGQQY